ncbi:MAG TPA: Ig-like domain repeat protein [Terriglobales bacterium]|nr:Ig-like domain repeat protein [Terriglobales bacterium]
MHMDHRLFLIHATVLVSLAVTTPLIHAQKVTTTVTTGTNPFAVAVNPVTNKTYVVNKASNNVTVIDGATNTTATVTTGTTPVAIAVNPATNKIYVANSGGNSVTVIDGATNTPATISDPNAQSPAAIAVNSVTNKIYVANSISKNVTVIDAASNNSVTALTDANASGPSAIGVNPVTNRIYVVNRSSGNMTVIDGAGNTIITTITVGSTPDAVAVNPVTNRIYVANENSTSVTVVDGALNTTITTVTAGSLPYSLAVNPVTNKVYVANFGGTTVTVIDGVTNAPTSVTAGTSPVAVAVDVVSNRIYVANYISNNVTVINGADNTTVGPLGVGTNPLAMGANPITNKVYVANNGGGVSVIDGATYNTVTVAAGSQDVTLLPNNNVAVNPATNKIYVANNGDGVHTSTVTVINGADNTTTSVNVGVQPVAVAVNPVANKIYVANSRSNNVTVIDAGLSNATTTVGTGSAPDAIAVNPVTNKIYVGRNGGVAVIDGNTNIATGVTTAGLFCSAVAVNPVTNRIYAVSVNGPSSGTLTVINGFDNSIAAAVPVGVNPFAVAVNPVTNRIYVANAADATVTVVDGTINSVITTVVVGGSPVAVDLNPLTNKIYVPAQGGNLRVIDGVTNVPVPVTTGNAQGVTVNPVTNKIYLSNGVVVDGATNSTSSVSTGAGPLALAANPVTQKTYVTNASGNVIVIAEQQVQPIPLTTTILPLTNNTFTNPGTPVFNFTTASSYFPTAPLVQNLYYQFDTWQGPWLRATSTGANAFSGAGPLLAPGIHIVYAYAADSQFADSTQTGLESSPIPGAIAAYVFLVVPTSSSTTLASNDNPAHYGDTVTLTATVTVSGTAATGIVDLLDGPTLLGSAPLSGSPAQATFTTSALSSGTHPLTARYDGGANYTTSISPILNQVVNPGVSSTVVSLSTGTNPSSFGQPLTFTAAVTVGLGTPTGTVTFYDGVTALGTGTLDGSGHASLATSALQIGARSITAVYPGDINVTGSTSAPITQTVTQATSGTIVALTTGATPSVFGQTLTFTATVGPQFTGLPTGTVTFYDGSTALGTGALNGSAHATLTTTTLPAGTRSITAVYAGDTNFSGSTSSPITQTVTQATSSVVVTLTGGTNPSKFGQAVSFTATVSPQFTGTPTGQIIFKVGNTIVTPHTLNGSAQAVITDPFMGMGVTAITAAYSGDANFTSSTSPAVNQTVNPNSGAAVALMFTTTPTISPNTSLFRKTVTLTATANPSAATGTVSFVDGNTLTLLGTATLSGGVATTTTSQFGLGEHFIAVSYSGDSTYITTSFIVVLYHSPKPH